MAHTVKLVYDFGQILYVVHDSMQKKRSLIKVVVTENGLLYGLAADGDYDEFYKCELSENPDPSFSSIKEQEDEE